MDFWKCKVCGAERSDAAISVFKRDITPEGMPLGTIMENVKFCNDREDCRQGAKDTPKPDLGKFVVRASDED